MFVCVARITLDLHGAHSPKARRQIVRRVSERVRARFNVSASEVDFSEGAEAVRLGIALVGNQRAFVSEQMDKLFQAIEQMYVAPVTKREREVISFGNDLLGADPDLMALHIPKGERSLAEVEGLGEWEHRYAKQTAASPVNEVSLRAPRPEPKLSLTDARARARALRNRRDWEEE